MNSNKYFTEKELNKLQVGYLEILEKSKSLTLKCILTKLDNKEAQEFLVHGFARRIAMLTRCVENIYQICPPNTERPSKEALHDLEINLHAFVNSAFGCLENLAWVWAKENKLKNKKGENLKFSQIGFGEKYQIVRMSFSKKFKSYLDSLKDWYDYLENFRHSLAHRIPFYIPPYCLTPENKVFFDDLNQESKKTLDENNHKEYYTISDREDFELKNRGRFIPWITHSFSEKSGVVNFYAQVIADFNTIAEIAEKLLLEIDKKNNK